MRCALQALFSHSLSLDGQPLAWQAPRTAKIVRSVQTGRDAFGTLPLSLISCTSFPAVSPGTLHLQVPPFCFVHPISATV